MWPLGLIYFVTKNQDMKNVNFRSIVLVIAIIGSIFGVREARSGYNLSKAALNREKAYGRYLDTALAKESAALARERGK